MKQLEVGDRVKVLNGDKDDEGTVLDVDERTEMVVVYLGRHVGGWAAAEGPGALTKAQGRRTSDGPPPSFFHARNLGWLKMKNPEAPAVKREAEEDWGKRR